MLAILSFLGIKTKAQQILDVPFTQVGNTISVYKNMSAIYRNGLRQKLGLDYNVLNGIIVFNQPILPDDVFVIDAIN